MSRTLRARDRGLAWLLALLLLLPVPVCLAAWSLTPGVVADMLVEAHMRAALARFAGVPHGGVTAVALSMSTNQCALRGPGPLDSGQVEVLPLYFPSAGFDDFVGLVPDIVRARPDMVLIEAGLLFRRYDLGDSLRLFRMNLVQEARSLVQGRGTVLDRYVAISGPCCPAGKPLRQQGPAAEGALPDDWTMTPEFGRLKAGIEAFASAGIRVAVVSTPMIAERHEIAVQRAGAAMAVLAAEVPGADIAFLAVPEAYPDTDFCDPLHVGAPGQARFSRWLDGQLVDLTRPGT
ncbi:MAG: hypothetical protein VYB54_04470 [Pseudomonadota bacterium]|nr:hypothetical protein [Pseudomonadota bacterium]